MSADHQNWVLASLAIGHRSHRTSVGLLVLMVGTDSQHSQFQGLGCPKTCVVLLVGRACPRIGSDVLLAGWVYKLWDCSFLASGVCPLGPCLEVCPEGAMNSCSYELRP